MGWLGKLLGREQGLVVRDGMCVFRRAGIAQYLPQPKQPNFGEVPEQICSLCNKAMPELLITTGGPLGDPEVWRDEPVAVDGWGCVGCGKFHMPRKMSPAQISEFLQKGTEHGMAGRFADAEWWFTRAVWDWPGYVPAHGNLAEATRERLRQSPNLDEPVRRRLRERMRDQYQAAVDSFESSPQDGFHAAITRAHLSLAELAIEDRAFPRALRSIKACLAMPRLSAAEAETAQRLQTYIEGRYDLFHGAATALNPYLDLMGRPTRPIETPDERKQVVQALEDLARHYQLAPTHWQAAWELAKGRAALDGVEAALDAWRHAWATHPGEKEIAREASLAFLRTGHADEAAAIDRVITRLHPDDATLWCNRAVTEILNGDLAEARRSLNESRRLDPADPVARNVEGRLAGYEGGKPLPRTLRDLERG